MLSSDKKIKNKIKKRKYLNEEELSLILLGLVKGLNMEAHDYTYVINDNHYIPECEAWKESYTVIVCLDNYLYGIEYTKNEITGDIVDIYASKLVDKYTKTYYM